MPDTLPPAFYARDTTMVARELLGKRLCHRLPGGELRSGIIVETEAYLGLTDKAAHTYGGKRTPRTETMYAAPGTAYVYLIYGMYHCLNAVTRAVDIPEAVLIRALEPEQGQAQWEQELPRLKPRQWLSGPGRLCRGMKIDKAQNGLSFCDSTLWIEEGRRVAKKEIEAGPRVGIGYAEEAVDWPLRFYLRKNTAVSKA
jgi:DNA-3-methyladenine glycosylase